MQDRINHFAQSLSRGLGRSHFPEGEDPPGWDNASASDLAYHATTNQSEDRNYVDCKRRFRGQREKTEP